MQFRRLLAAGAAALVLAAGTASSAAASTSPAAAAPLASQGGGGCSWQYHFTISTTGAGGIARIWLTNSTCGAGWPQMRAILACTLRSTVLVYGPWVRPSAVSQAACSSTTVPSYLNEQVKFSNGTTATFRDWTR